jgi:hypothetical protein
MDSAFFSDEIVGNLDAADVEYTLQLHKLPRGSSGKGVEDRVAASL